MSDSSHVVVRKIQLRQGGYVEAVCEQCSASAVARDDKQELVASMLAQFNALHRHAARGERMSTSARV